MHKCPTCQAPAEHSAPDGDLRYAPTRTPPEGWVLVPREPTKEMTNQVVGFFMTTNPERAATAVYEIMIAAAPKSGEK